jgi:putative oxidoreductase
MPNCVLSLLARVMMAAIYLQSGYGKMMHADGTIAYIAKVGYPVPHVAYYVAVAAEFFGGLAFLLGFQTRWVSAVLAVFTLAAGVGVHYHPDDVNQMIHFMKNIAIAGGFLHFAATGAGALSLDSMLGRKPAIA